MFKSIRSVTFPWLQDPNRIHRYKSADVRSETSGYLSSERGEYVGNRIGDAGTDCKDKKNYTLLYRRSEFQKVCHPVRLDCLQNPTVLWTSGRVTCQLMNVRGVNDVIQTEERTIEPGVSEGETTVRKLRRYENAGVRQITVELTQSVRTKVCFEIRIFINFCCRCLGGVVSIPDRFTWMGFVVDKTALRPCFLEVLRFSLVTIPPLLHTHIAIYRRNCTILAIDSVVKQHMSLLKCGRILFFVPRSDKGDCCRYISLLSTVYTFMQHSCLKVDEIIGKYRRGIRSRRSDMCVQWDCHQLFIDFDESYGYVCRLFRIFAVRSGAS